MTISRAWALTATARSRASSQANTRAAFSSGPPWWRTGARSTPCSSAPPPPSASAETVAVHPPRAPTGPNRSHRGARARRSSIREVDASVSSNGYRASGPRRSIAVVGAGFGGVGAAAMLRRAGYEDVTVFERGERVGGVWHDNTYPGAACDVPSHLYEFSFQPNPRWSRRYAPQQEIQQYLEDVARAHGVLERIRTGTEVRSASWDPQRERW